MFRKIVCICFVLVIAGEAQQPMVRGTLGSGQVLLGKLASANMNVTTDQSIRINHSIRSITVTNASISLTTAAGGFYTAVSKGGTAIVAAGQVYSSLTSATVFLDTTLAAPTSIWPAAPIYLSLTTAQGAAARADVQVFGKLLP
jgi:hypothetical protein